MHPVLLIPLFAVVGSALTAGIIFARDPNSAANRQLALLSLGTAFWAICEVMWNTAPDAETALFYVRLSALGFVWIGPVCLHVFLAAAEERSPADEHLLAAGYGLAGVMLVLAWTTPWMHPAVVRTAWGWAYQPGPLFPVFFLLTLVGFGAGLWSGIKAYRRYASPAERSQGVPLLLTLGGILVTASLTDAVLPLLGVQLPRLGTATLTLLGVSIAWSYFRFGYALLAPGRFAPEILESLSDGVLLARLDGRIRNANRGMARLLKQPVAALRGRGLHEVLPFVGIDPPRSFEALEGELDASPRRPIPVSVSGAVLRDKRDLPIGLVLVVHDLREVTALRDRLVTSGRLAAVGELAAGVAHEINNPIAYVRTNLGLLRSHWQRLTKEVEDRRGSGGELDEALDEGDDLIGECVEGIDRAAAIVRDVKAFSHAGSRERVSTDLAPLLERVLRVAAPQLRGRARVQLELDPGLPPVRCAPQELQQVFLNLILNAGHAVGAAGRIRIESYRDRDDAVVVVADDGDGIAPEDLDRIFDPFFTTKPVGEGTGLGLAISYQIVRNHGGEIRVESAPGEGTAFRVRLPLG